jgi:hypothetical protein
MVRNADGSLTFNGTATADVFFYTSTVNGSASSTNTGLINIKAGTYTLSGCPAGGTATTYVERLYEFTLDDEYKNTSYSDTGGGNTFVINDDCKYRVGIRFANGITVSNLTFKPQLEVGETATEYEPNNGATYPVTFPSEAGTVYGGTLTVNSDGSGTLTVDHGMRVFDGSEQWALNGSGGAYRTPRGVIPAMAKDCVCNMLLMSNTSGAPSGYGYVGSANILVYLDNATAENLASWVEFLQSTNMQVVYPLSTPTTYALSSVQVAELLQGVNNLWADAAGTLSAEYYANTALYVDKKIAELQALILENQ